MADRIVYLVDQLPRNLAADEPLEFVDDVRLTELTAGEGYEVVNTLPERKIRTAAGKTVKASMMILRPGAENRGVSVAGRRGDDEDPPQRNRGMVTVVDGYGRQIQMSPGQAMVHEMSRGLARLGAAGHLGPTGDHNMPGLTVISGELVAKAWDSGALAAARGEPKSANPFPGGSEAHTLWLQGWTKITNEGHGQAAAVSPEALQRAEEEGYTLAQSLGKDDVVHCPYPRGTQQRERWLEGFKRGGGRVE